MRDDLKRMAEDEEPQKGLAVERLRAAWARRKWLAVLVFALPFVAALSVIFALPTFYRSTALVLVERQQVPEAFVPSTVTSELETRLHTISQEILSRSRLESLITRLGLYPGLRKQVSTEELVERMRKDVKLELKTTNAREGRQNATTAFALSYRGSDPQTVALVTNTIASFYIEENLKVRERQATGTAEFLKVQLTETRKRLDELEARVSEFRRRYLGELPQQMDANLATLERLHAQLRQNSDNQTRATERRQALSSQLAEAELLLSPAAIAAAGPGATMLAPPEMREAIRLAQKKEELAKLRTQFSDKYPDIVQLTAEVAALERELAEAKARITKPDPDAPAGASSPPAAPLSPYALRLKEALSEVQSDLRILKTEEGRLKESIAAYQARVENVPKREQEFREMSRDYESTRELYGSLLKRYEEAQLAESMEQRQKGEQFRLLDPAVPNQQPAAPNRLRLLLMIVAGSLGLAVGVVLLAEHVDTSFHEVDDLRTFSNIPVLVSIPRITTSEDRRRSSWRMRFASAATLVGLVLIVGIAYLAATGNDRLAMLLARLGS